jgi:hypothetical protein
VVTIPVPKDRRLRLDLITASISGGGPVALTIEQDTSVPADTKEILWEELVVTGQQPTKLDFGPDGYQCPAGGDGTSARDVVITVPAAGVGNVSRLNVLHHFE